MAFSLPDFLSARPATSNVPDPFAGYRSFQATEQAEKQIQQNELFNRLQEIRNKYEPQKLQQEQERGGYDNQVRQAEAAYAEQKEQANLQRTLAEAERMRRGNKLGFAGELTGELGNRAKVHALEQELGTDNELVKALKKQIDRQEYGEDLRNKQIESINSSRGFNQLPAAEKSLLLGKLRAADIPDRDIESIKNGDVGFSDYLTNRGWSPEEIASIVPKQAATSATQSAAQQIQGALAEDEYIGPKITEALGPYSTKILGYSPEQIMQAFEDNPTTLDQRARALAARALVPEVAGYRTRIAGGSESHKALAELTENSLNKLEIFDSLVTPKEYHLAQKYIHEWQQGMGEARIRGLQGVAQKPSLSKTLEKGLPEESAHMFDVDGQAYEIPADKVEAFKKAFPGARKK